MDEVERLRLECGELRVLLAKAHYWMGAEHCREYWARNEPYQKDLCAVQTALKPTPCCVCQWCGEAVVQRLTAKQECK